MISRFKKKKNYSEKESLQKREENFIYLTLFSKKENLRTRFFGEREKKKKQRIED